MQVGKDDCYQFNQWMLQVCTSYSLKDYSINVKQQEK